MKRNLFLACLMAAVIFGFVGCGGKTTTEGSTTATTTTTPSTDPDAVGDPNRGKHDPSGTYEMRKDDGTVATLKVTKAGDKISYTLDASVGNAAEMTRSAMMTLVADQEYEDADDACNIVFVFGNGNVDLSYVGDHYQGCGEVDCAGSYMKK